MQHFFWLFVCKSLPYNQHWNPACKTSKHFQQVLCWVIYFYLIPFSFNRINKLHSYLCMPADNEVLSVHAQTFEQFLNELKQKF